jgi:hypothetical protein
MSVIFGVRDVQITIVDRWNNLDRLQLTYDLPRYSVSR